MELLRLFAVTFLVFIAIDIAYLGYVGKNFVEGQLRYLMGPTNWPIAILFYIQYVFGLIYFVIDPALAAGEPTDAFKNGAFFGFFMYATYELTNYAILKKWPKTFVIPDIIWGTFLSAFVAIITFTIIK